MHPLNKRHTKRVLAWSTAAVLPLAGGSLFFFPPLIAASVLTGAAISYLNILSIVRLTEALAGAALEAGVSRTAKAFATIIHVFKLVLILAVLAALVFFKLTNLFALLAGFTVVLFVNLLSGFAALGGGPDDKDTPSAS